jgi:hypothetical protein
MVSFLMNAPTACRDIAGDGSIVDFLLSEVLMLIGFATNEIDA